MKPWIAASVVLALMTAVPARAQTHARSRADWPADCRLTPVAELPMSLQTGHVVIPASANGKDLTLGIDPGGFGTSLTDAGVAKLGIAASDVQRLGAVIPSIGGLWVSAGSVHLHDLRIGDLELDSVHLPELAAFPGVDGLIGPDILAKYDAEFDFAGKSFRLFKPHPCSDHAVSWTGSYTVIPFTLTRDGHVRVRVTLDGQNADAILDTGAPISALSMKDAHGMFGLTAQSAEIEAAKPVSGPAWSGPVHAYTYPFQKLTMGGVVIPGPRMELVEGRNFLGHDFATLVLGNDVLSRFHLYIAYRQQKLYLTPADAH